MILKIKDGHCRVYHLSGWPPIPVVVGNWGGVTEIYRVDEDD